MRKLKIFFYNLILFIFLSCPIHAKASSITLSVEALSNIETAIDYLAYAGSFPFDYASFFAFSSDANKSYESIVENYLSKPNVYTVNGTHIFSRELTQSELELLQSEEFYDENGNLIDLSNLCYATVDNGYFTEHLYIKNDGSMAYLDANKDSPALDVKFGGKDFSYLDWQNTYNGIYNNLSDSAFNYSLDDTINLANSNISVYYAVGWKNKYRDYTELNIIYVPNIYSVDMKVANSTYPGNIYCKNGANPIIVSVPSGTVMGNRFWNVNYNGVTYDVQYDYSRYFTTGYTTSLSNFMTMGRDGNDYLIDYNGWTYDSNLANLYNTNQILSFKKLDNIGDSLDLSKAYTMATIEDIVDDVGSIAPTGNPAFDPTTSITDINYPLIYEADLVIPDVAIPFPEDVVVDDTPAIDYPLTDTIDPTLITNNIPIISGLENKFPFSIPWDIYRLVNGLSITRETPAINETITIPIINYDWNIDLDLSMYDDSAELFRRLFLILFIIGLAVFSYQHFFGS